MHMSTHIAVRKRYNYMKYMANLFCLYIVDWQCYSVFVNLKGFSVVFPNETLMCLRSDTQASKYLGLCQYVCTGHPHVERV